jgi:hypothetical protein
VIRLRQGIETGLRHPLLGPVLLLFLGLILAFVVFHTIEHGVEGALFSCAILAAVALRLVVVLGRVWRERLGRLPLVGRGPPQPAVSAFPLIGRPAVLFALPLRR